MLTRKHFKGIAGCVSEVRERLDRDKVREEHTAKEIAAMEKVLDVMSDVLADEMRQHNPNFNRDRFMEACGVK